MVRSEVDTGSLCTHAFPWFLDNPPLLEYSWLPGEMGQICITATYRAPKQTPLNRSQQLPTPYKRLIDGLTQN